MTTTAQLNLALDGRYRIEREIGAGGMATVYLARDLRHDRHVALKVLRPELSAILGADRFLKEIRTTANLQHPHILPLHDSGEADGLVFYVMPFVEGESLRDKLTRDKQLGVDESVRLAKEVASALDYAHRRGVVHRDIKPENILLHDGQALVADFGIALAVSTVGGGTRMTETGMSLGTPHYMAPEQAMGEREITPRADIYALGAVLYEMLLGEPPFTGPTAQAIVARVVTEEPRSLTLQRKTIPPHVEAAVHTALAKLPADRFATAAEFAQALSDTSAPARIGATTAMRAAHVRRPSPRTMVLVAVGGAAVGFVIGALAGPRLMPSREATGGTNRFIVTATDTASGLASLAGSPEVSPDGRIVAFSGVNADTVALFVQPLDRFEQWAVPGGGRGPFFSPDSRWIGFLRGSSVWKVSSAGGEPTRIGQIDDMSWNIWRRGVWSTDGQIYFATTKGIVAIPAAGGASRLLDLRDSANAPSVNRVELAPEGSLLLGRGSGKTNQLVLYSPHSGKMKALPADTRWPAWFVGELLLFSREGQYYVSAFDVGDARPTGEAIPVTEVPRVGDAGVGASSAWPDASSSRRVTPVWVNRKGEVTPVGIESGDYRWPRLSPDGRRFAVKRINGPEALTVVDVATRSQLLLQIGGRRGEPVWFHDNRRIVSSATTPANQIGLVVQVADGTTAADTLLGASFEESWPTDIARGDTLVVYYGGRGDDEQDVFVMNVRTKEKRRLAQPGGQRGGRLSPDGRWLAYQSIQGGRTEVIVQPWPALDAKYLVSPNGGDEPAWSADSRELFFRSGAAMMMLPVTNGPTWTPSQPVELFRGPFARDPSFDQSYDVARDGRFLMLQVATGSRLQIRVIQNWEAELKRRLASPTGSR